MQPANTSGVAAQSARDIQRLEFMGRIPCERRNENDGGSISSGGFDGAVSQSGRRGTQTHGAGLRAHFQAGGILGIRPIVSRPIPVAGSQINEQGRLAGNVRQKMPAGESFGQASQAATRPKSGAMD